MENEKGVVFEICIDESTVAGNTVYIVYDKRQLKDKRKLGYLLFKKKLDYIARVEISKTTGEIINVKTGNGCTPSQVVEIINISSYIALNKSFEREDPIIYLSAILSIPNIKNFNEKIDIRFPIYGMAGVDGALEKAESIIDEYFRNNPDNGKKLIIPYAVIEENKDANGKVKSKIDHIVILIVKEEIKQKTQQNVGVQKRQRTKEEQKEIKYKIQCFDSSLTFFKHNKKREQIDYSRYFGSLANRATISQLNNNDLQCGSPTCSYFIESFMKCLVLEKSHLVARLKDDDPKEFWDKNRTMIEKEIKDMVNGQIEKIKSRVKNTKEGKIEVEKEKGKEEGKKILSANPDDYKGTTYLLSSIGRGVELDKLETQSQILQSLHQPRAESLHRSASCPW